MSSIKTKLYGWSIPQQIKYQQRVYKMLYCLDPEAVKENQMEIADQLYYEFKLSKQYDEDK